jgi:high affinity Mn2+ porin
LTCLWLAIAGARPLTAQSAPDAERWNLYFQATSIGQYHGSFPAKYSGPFSLLNHPEGEVSLTSTLFFGLRLTPGTQLYFDPELAGGRGFSATDGVANFPNGEMPRVATATPKPYLARLYITHDFGFGEAREATESGANQLAGSRPMTRYSVTVGRFTVTDFFDNNKYTHDPRTQFMGWGIMYNGAWDYPADTRGYTWGWMHEFHTARWSLRYAGVAEPRTANGLRFDRRLLRDRGDIFEGEVRGKPKGHEGAIRLLGFLHHTASGTYADAIRVAEQTGGTPDVVATRRVGTLKYGFGVSADQEITGHVGVFGRLGWNDGKTESFAFTAIDRVASGGFSVKGGLWKRPDDTAATEITVSGLSGVHRLYLSRGGVDFLIGDGRLNYGRETIWETYYRARLFDGFFATLDLQHIDKPAYNKDRGPVWAESLRLHVEWGRK